MQEISARINFSETAFVKKSSKADFRVEFFTPNKEIDLCGHATIGTFYLLKELGFIKEGQYTQETKAGILDIECRSNKNIFMQQNKPKFYEIIDKKEVASSLNIREEEIIDKLPVQVVSTGLKDILIPVKNLKILYNIKPDFNKIASISERYSTVGYHVFTLETEGLANAGCRNFAPLYDIEEEAATGTSNGALSCYLYKYGVVSEDDAKNMIFEQGYSMKKPSEIFASLKIENGGVFEVKVGGTALDVNEKFIEI